MKQAVILAAGLGSRLGDLTRDVPKALIEIAEKPLIDYALAFSAAAGVSRRIVVGGYYFDDVEKRVATVTGADADIDTTVVENTEFKKGNLVTLGNARDKLADGVGFLLMNVDHIYNPAIADIVAGVIGGSDEVTAFCDTDRTLTNDDMKVSVDDDGRVAAMSKTLESWDWGYVGMTFIPSGRVADYWDAAAGATDRLGDAIHVESVLVELARRGAPPVIADISGHGWLEVDEPHERQHAEGVLADKRWWFAT